MGDQKQPLWQAVVAGSVGGASATLVGHPFETVKVRLQTGETKNLFRNLYAGVLSPLTGVTPLWALAYFAYKFALGQQSEDTSPMVRGAMAGAFSGGVGCVVKTPVEAIKIVAQNEHTSAGAAIRKILSQEGVKGLYRGNLATVCLMVPSQFIFFCTYETGKDYFGDYGLVARSFIAGGLAGLMEWTTTMPMDVVKTKCQSSAGIRYLEAWSSVWRAQGFRGFYKGYIPAVLRAFPANGAAFLGIEFVNQTFRDSLGSVSSF